MDKFSVHRAVFELLEALCNDRLEPEQHDRLQSILRENPEAQQLYLEYIDTHLALGRLLRRSELVRVGAPGEGRSSPGATKRKGWSRFVAGLAILSAAAAVIVAVSMSLRTRVPGPESKASLAGSKSSGEKEVGTPRLIQSAMAKFFGGGTLPRGARLPFHEEFVLVDGFLKIAFVDGATVIISAPAAFEVADRACLFMKIGRCSVHAPEGAQGFRIETPVGQVIDLGTRFAVDVSDMGEAEVQVVEGLAEVLPKETLRAAAAAAPIHLEAGQAQFYAVDRELKVKVNDVRFDRSKYLARLPDRIVAYTATEHPRGGADELLTVSVQRGGKLHFYSVDELIGIDLIHYKAAKNGSIVTELDDVESSAPGSRRRHSLLDRDRKLTTGVINPGESLVPLASDPILNDPEDPRHPNTPGFAVRFHEPVVNGPGPDLVIFDVQPIIHRVKGDPFLVSPLRFAPGLKSHPVMNFDIDLLSPEALTLADVRPCSLKAPVHSLTDLANAAYLGGQKLAVRAKGLATGVDLSDLGYKPGEGVEGLFFQATLVDFPSPPLIDPVFIGGFPSIDRESNASWENVIR